MHGKSRYICIKIIVMLIKMKLKKKKKKNKNHGPTNQVDGPTKKK